MFNAFDKLGLDVDFDLNKSDLEQAYLTMMKICHPDQQVVTTNETMVLDEAVSVNQAYKVLKDPYLRAQHCLQLQKFSFNFDTSTSSDILMESMSLRESLEDAEAVTCVDHLLKDVKNKKEIILADLISAFKNNDLSKACHLTEHLGYLNKFQHEAQEKLWALEETNILMENTHASSAA
ncbi:MAG: Fe-S protein assembly co-chaperone HscB [Janthinobacterium lividum]